MKIRLFAILSFISAFTFGQFPGIVGSPGTTAMFKDSSAFVAWASSCKVTRGYQDITNTGLGYAAVGDSSFVLSKADGGVVSLGDGGFAILTFTTPITNGNGPDFAVFENAFNDSFLELAFVEVSSDGLNYFRFPPTSNLPVSPQYTNDAAMDATKINNLAGKYRSQYGTPFDLEELKGIPQLNTDLITHVKIIDVVGSINSMYGTYDKNNTIINDPWPTPFPSSGFDLDAVGVIHQGAVGIKEHEQGFGTMIYPNPSSGKFYIRTSESKQKQAVKLLNGLGEKVYEGFLETNETLIDLSDFNSGIYFISIVTEKGIYTSKFIKE